MIKDNAQQLLNKEMDRKDFLKHVGVALLAVAGVSTVLANLSKLQTSSDTANKASGYGVSSYGR